jgi:ABC-2 type transport system permease protein/lipopolysaccharide transport system permease protein
MDMDVNDRTETEASREPSGPIVANRAVLPDEPPPELRYRVRFSLLGAARDAWNAREITRSLAERSIRSRYKQAVLGFAWSILTPLVLMFAAIFISKKIGVAKDGVPLALFSYLGTLPWTFFSNSVSNGSTSIVSNISLINKVPCPREVFPLSGVAQALFDAVLSTLPLIVLFAVNTFMPRPETLWLPVILAVLLAFATGAAILFSVLVVYIRDLRTALPLILQFGFFVTPVVFPFSQLPANTRGIYSVINPLGPTIDALRRTMLEGAAPNFTYLGLGAIGALLYLVGGYVIFKRMEAGIADIA